MPLVAENLKQWEHAYEWDTAGDEWSEPWGGSHMMWTHCIYPRIRKHIPANVILEIAPGHGRWTNYLKEYAQELHLVDLSANCIQACQKRFADADNIHYYVNNGYDLAAIPDGSVDFVFCFDSLVHVELDCLSSYIQEIGRILAENGTAFIHHSNLAYHKRNPAYYYYKHAYDRIFRRVPPNRFFKKKLFNSWRGSTVSYQKVKEVCHQNNLYCEIQELIDWHSGSYLKDCITTISRNVDAEEVVIKNHDFMTHAALIKGLGIYT